MLVDTHAHLDFNDDVEGWIARAREADVTKIICVGTSVEASRKCVEIAEQHRTGTQIYASVGIHAQDGKADIKKFGSLYQCINTLKQIASGSRKVVGVGECGFDFKSEVRGQSTEVSDEERKYQKKLFEAQIGLAAELKLPLVVHCRNAFDETFDFLSKYVNYSSSPLADARGKLRREVSLKTNNSSKGKFSLRSNNNKGGLRGVFHSWTGDWEAAKKALNLGFYISFSGIVTFKNAPNVQEVAKKMPLDAMLLETDSPFLSPEPDRGLTNEPKNVKIVAQFIARLRNLPVDQIANVTSQNAGRLFGI